MLCWGSEVGGFYLSLFALEFFQGFALVLGQAVLAWEVDAGSMRELIPDPRAYVFLVRGIAGAKVKEVGNVERLKDEPCGGSGVGVERRVVVQSGTDVFQRSVEKRLWEACELDGHRSQVVVAPVKRKEVIEGWLLELDPVVRNASHWGFPPLAEEVKERDVGQVVGVFGFEHQGGLIFDIMEDGLHHLPDDPKQERYLVLDAVLAGDATKSRGPVLRWVQGDALIRNVDLVDEAVIVEEDDDPGVPHVV